MGRELIEVTCALIVREGRLLFAQRSEQMSNPLKWEFPGGKREPDESVEHCIKREILEELNLEIEIITALPASEFDSGMLTIRLLPFHCRVTGGKLKLKEHLGIAWATEEEAIHFDLSPADVPVLQSWLAHSQS
jgi:8-oxo-dGTP diphosphatase